MLKIFSAENLADAHLVQGMLNEAGVKTRIMNEYAQGGVGELPFTHTYPEIWLENDADTTQAREIISRFEQRTTDINNLTCPNCGEVCPETFEVCWRCGTPLAEASKPDPAS